MNPLVGDMLGVPSVLSSNNGEPDILFLAIVFGVVIFVGFIAAVVELVTKIKERKKDK